MFLCTMLMAHSQASIAAEKTYRMSVSGCWGWAGKARISSILKKTDGILDFKLNSTTSTVTVKFEDSKIDGEGIVEKIREKKFQVGKKTEIK